MSAKGWLRSLGPPQLGVSYRPQADFWATAPADRLGLNEATLRFQTDRCDTWRPQSTREARSHNGLEQMKDVHLCAAAADNRQEGVELH